MYQTILVTLDGTATDRAIVEHIKQLAMLARSRLVLLHVADGWAARTYGPDAVSPEIAEDTLYLEKVRSEFQALGIPTEAELAYGEPANEIIKWVRQKGCDLVAMSTHGHRFLSDVFLGPQPAGSSTVLACPFSFSGRSEVSAGPSGNTDGLRDHLDHVQRWNTDANATGETLYCLPQLAGKPLAICGCDLDSLSCC